MNDRDLLLGLIERRVIEVPVTMPGGGQHTFRIQSLTTAERAKYLDSMWDKAKNAPAKLEEMQVRLVAMTLVDEAGQLVFKASERSQLLAVDGSVVGQLHDAAVQHNAIGRRALEDEMGNSPETPDEDS